MAPKRASSNPPEEVFRIGEAAALTELAAYVLRYWETEFPSLHPGKTPSGQRRYRRQDIETILTIKHLLYEEGFTIAGARKQLQARSQHQQLSAPEQSQRAAERAAWREIHDELARLLTLLRKW